MSDARKLVVVAGPTASGKSALALAIAEEFGGIVINADAMQLYAGLEIVTAQPDAADRARAPHRLYGVLRPDQLGSAGVWKTMAEAECAAAWQEGQIPVVVGGTGLYLRALLHGLAPIPDIPADIRAASRALLAELGNERFHARLAERDPDGAAALPPTNSQRLTRAWEVLEATGHPLSHWQAQQGDGLAADSFAIAVIPPADTTAAACDVRFRKMVEAGALEEVRALMAQHLDPALPALKALGVPQLAEHLAGRITLDQAIVAAQGATRRYAKRQRTWLRHQLVTDYLANAQFSESLTEKIFPKIRGFLLTSPN